MKKIILLTYLVHLSISCPSQTFDEWFKQKATQKKYLVEQIAALKAYGLVLEEGYQIVSQGLDLVHAVRNGDFIQHQDHFDSYSIINPFIKDQKESEKMDLLYRRIQQTNLFTSEILKKEDSFTRNEENSLLQILLEIQQESNQLYSEFKNLLKKGNLKMTDQARMSRLNHTYQEMQKVNDFANSLYMDCQFIKQNRQLENLSISQFQSLVFSTKNP